MYRTLACLAAVSMISSAAHAAPASVQEAFGNTIVSTYPDGRKGELWLQAGGAYTAEGRRGDMSSGHWTVKGSNLCLKQAKPIGVPISFCTPIPTSGLGGTWSAKAVTGEAIKVRLVKGHAQGSPKT
jgi:hypothetical protein